MFKQLYFVSAIIFSVLLLSCSKGEDASETSKAPMLTVTQGTSISVAYDARATLSWTTNGVNVTVNGAAAPNGTFTSAALQTDTVFTLVAYSPDFSSNGLSTSVQVKVTVLPNNVDVYIAGFQAGSACYWKNGVQTILATTTSFQAEAHDIAVSGSDVYVVGRVESDAMVWKNGNGTKLNEGTLPSKALAIALDGSDVYISGNDNKYSRVVYWKNGVTTVLSSLNRNIAAGNYIGVAGTCIAVSGTDVYVAGDTALKAFYWKNGVQVPLSNTAGISYVTDIVLSGKDVYISGGEDDSAVYWKNGVKTVLATQNSRALGIAVSGNDVYVVGNDEVHNPVYWKNGVKTILSRTNDNAYATSIAIDGSDIHITGYIGVPVYWKNGIRKTLAGNGGFYAANAIKIVKR